MIHISRADIINFQIQLRVSCKNIMSNLSTYDIIAKDCIKPNYNGQNLTNRVLIEQVQQKEGKKKFIYYCPGYMRIKIKNFSEMSLEDLSATINIVLSLSTSFLGMPSVIENYIQEQIILRFNRDEPIKLEQDNQEVNKRKQPTGLYTYTVRKLLQAGMKADIFLSPFQIIYLILTVQIQEIRLSKQAIGELIKKTEKQISETIKQKRSDDEKQKQTQLQEIEQLKKQCVFLRQVNQMIIKFNLMDYSENPFSKISYSEQGTFGNYDLAEQLLKVEYTNEDLAQKIRVEIEDDKQEYEDFGKIIQFQNAHFQIPLYKFPFVTLSTIFIPLWLLGIINLGIFFQDNGLGDRIGSLSALMIAFVALLPVIRSSLPPNPSVTLVEILVYLQTLTVLFCFIESVTIRNQTQYKFQWFSNGLFLVSMIIQIMEVVTITMFMIIHKCCWERSYNRHVSDVGDLKFDYLKWSNAECDSHFRRKLDTGTIKILDTWKNLRREKEKKNQQIKDKKQKK